MTTPEERAAEITAQFYPVETIEYRADLDLTDMIAQAIREAVEAAAPRWIPVGERLPEPCVDVLILLYGDDPRIGHYYGGEWWSDSETHWVGGIDVAPYWMPLPGPPDPLS
jgi:hypothetical protein